jgi:hypothetical protein
MLTLRVPGILGPGRHPTTGRPLEEARRMSGSEANKAAVRDCFDNTSLPETAAR